MLPTNRRVKKESFNKIMKEGFFVHSEHFYLRFLFTGLENLTNISFVVPNKVKKTSVGRHLIKRKMSAVVEKLLITLKPGFLLVFFAKKDLSDTPFSELEKDFLSTLRKAQVLI